jgi:PadR family transcriptional regulator, regulatory protein PadR
MTRPRRPSAQTIAVVLALSEEPATWRYGYALCQQLGLKAGSVYPILMRLADRGLLETAWERDVPAGRPPRHLYRLTGPGRVLAAELAAAPPVPAKVARAGGAIGRRPRPEGT